MVAQHQLFWIPVETVDLPVSLLIQILAPDSMALYIVLFAILGSIQYAAIGWGVDYKVSKDRSRLAPNRFFLIAVALVVIGISYWAYVNISYSNLSDFEKSQIALNKAKTESDRFDVLGRAAKISFKSKRYDEAGKYAKELLTIAARYKDDPIYGNAIYDGHVVLGKLALNDGRPEKAIHELLEAVRTPGSATLATFGPDMSLARDLLKEGYKKPVIEFLIGCKSFWEYDDGKIDKWIKDINEGKMPDFGNSIRE